MWYKLSRAIGQKFPKKTEMNKNESIFVYFGYSWKKKTFQEELDPLDW